MKYALCLSGQPRFFEQCGPRLMEMITSAGVDCDVFIHAWTAHEKYSGASWSGDYYPYENLRERLISVYTPTMIFVEQDKDSLFKEQTSRIKKNTGAEPYIQASMFYSIYQSAALRRLYSQISGIEYDCVIRSRFDYYIVDGSDHFMNKIEEQKLYFADVIKNKSVVCDYWMLGSKNTLEKVENAYFHLFKKQSFFGKKMDICGEGVITDLIEFKNIEKKPLYVLGGLMRDQEMNNKRFGKWS